MERLFSVRVCSLIMVKLLAASNSGAQDAKSTNVKNNLVDTEALQNLHSILNQYDLTNMNEDDQKNLLDQLNQAGLLNSGNVINISA